MKTGLVQINYKLHDVLKIYLNIKLGFGKLGEFLRGAVTAVELHKQDFSYSLQVKCRLNIKAC